MIKKKEIRFNILELCSESEYGSWEFWPNEQERTENEANCIFEVILELVKEKKIIPTEYKFVIDQTYQEVQLDENRLRREMIQSIKIENVDTHASYWFLATEKGEKEYNDLYVEDKGVRHS